MSTDFFIKERVRKSYWDDDVNCVTTTLRILGKKFGLQISDQVFDAALGMHGAGGNGAQCGLVEGSLLFLGIFGRANRLPDDTTVELCKEFAQAFEARFSSLQCNILRPEGFTPDNPPHLCENLTCETTAFAISFINSKAELLNQTTAI